VAAEHLLLGIIAVEGAAASLLKTQGVTKDRILSALVAVRGNRRVTDQDAEEKYRVLERYTRDLTTLARADKLDPVIGRDEEIRRVMQVLSRRTKNNPSSSASRVSARPPSSKDWRGASSGRCPRQQ